MRQLLVVDDQEPIRYSINRVFKTVSDVEVFEAANADQALDLAKKERPQVVLLDVRLERESGFELIDRLQNVDPNCQVVFMTGHGTADTAIEAMKLGACNYLLKPLDAELLKQVVNQAFEINERIVSQPIAENLSVIDGADAERLIGSSPAMQTLFKHIGRVAGQLGNILILGEVGNEIDLVAKAVVRHSTRREMPFRSIDCAAASEFELELFGSVSLPGGVDKHGALLDACRGGTLLLENIGEARLESQAKILRLLQHGVFSRLGSSETLTADVRIIATSNQNLELLVEQNRFRRDLYYELREITLQLPPLRERRDDIPELAHAFLFMINPELGTAVQSISQETLDLLQNYNWPGNYRELKNVIRHAVAVSTGSTLIPEYLPDEFHADDQEAISIEGAEIAAAGDEWNRISEILEAGLQADLAGVYRRALEQFDRLVIQRTLLHTKGNQLRTAEMLGISRPTLRSKLRSLKMIPPKESSDSQ